MSCHAGLILKKKNLHEMLALKLRSRLNSLSGPRAFLSWKHELRSRCCRRKRTVGLLKAHGPRSEDKRGMELTHLEQSHVLIRSRIDLHHPLTTLTLLHNSHTSLNCSLASSLTHFRAEGEEA